MSLFYFDKFIETSITWETLISDLSKESYFNRYCFYGNYYEIFKSIIKSMILHKEIIMLDSDFSSDEISRLTEIKDISTFQEIIDLSFLSNYSKLDLIKLIQETNDKWKITLYTSGTTGIPKKVIHSFSSITRFVKKSESHNANIWGFAYNPTHMAGIQVFFQAFLNGNTIIRLFGLSKEDIFRLVNKYLITNISATPTFYRLLLPHDNQYFSVLKITSGGEKFDNKTLSSISAIFPKAKIYNIYASTEAGTLFAAKDNCFEINNNIVNYIKIIDNELYIHNSLMGEYVNDSNSEWYATGDIVEIISTLPLQFVFKSRKNDMINIGGYKVNPNEVEDIIRSIVGIVDVRVYSKKNSVLGNIILCDVVTNELLISEATIRSNLKDKIQEYKIPRVIRFVKELEISRTGKIKRM